MRSKYAKITQAHGLPKIHKYFESLAKFRLNINTTNTSYYGMSKFVPNLLNPFIENEYVGQDSFLQPKIK